MVLEGGERVEKLWKKVSASEEQGKVRTFKKEALEAVAKDVANHLGVGWPVVDEGAEQVAVRKLYESLGRTEVVRNVHEQYRWSAELGAKTRKEGTFLLQFCFGAEVLEAQKVF